MSHHGVFVSIFFLSVPTHFFFPSLYLFTTQ